MTGEGAWSIIIRADVKKKPANLKTEAALAFSRKFAPAKISRYTVCDITAACTMTALHHDDIIPLLGCHLKCHKEHADKGVKGESAMQPCVGGERDVKRVLLLIKNDEDRERWLNQLSRITLAREDSQRPPSPS